MVAVIALGIGGCASAGLEHNKAGLHYLHERDPSTAEAEFRQAVAVDPDNAMFYNNLGIALSRQQRYEEALAAYRHAVDLKSNYAPYHANLGGVYYALGESEVRWPSSSSSVRRGRLVG